MDTYISVTFCVMASNFSISFGLCLEFLVSLQVDGSQDQEGRLVTVRVMASNFSISFGLSSEFHVSLQVDGSQDRGSLVFSKCFLGSI